MGLEPLLVLRAVDEAEGHAHAEALQAAGEGRVDALEGGLEVEELDRHRLAGLGVDELPFLRDPAGLLEQGACGAQVAPVVAGAVGRGRHEGLGEDLLRHGGPVGFEEGEFGLGRQTARRELRVLEVARHAVVEPIELVLVEPLEVEGVGERLAHAAVLELRAAVC